MQHVFVEFSRIVHSLIVVVDQARIAMVMKKVCYSASSFVFNTKRSTNHRRVYYTVDGDAVLFPIAFSNAVEARAASTIREAIVASHPILDRLTKRREWSARLRADIVS